MSRDPLDAAIDVLLDQARVIRFQLEDDEDARAGLREIGKDPDAMAAEVFSQRDLTLNLSMGNMNAKATVRFEASETARVLTAAALWFTQLSAATSIGKHSGSEPVASVCEQLREATRPGHRRFGQTLATLRATLPVLTQNRATLEPVSIFAMTIAEGERLLGWFERHDTALRAAALVRKQATKAENEARKELLRTLRDVRRTWTAAASVCAGLPDRRMPDLDLRICKAAAGQAKGSRKRKGAVENAPAVAEAVSGAVCVEEPPAVEGDGKAPGEA